MTHWHGRGRPGLRLGTLDRRPPRFSAISAQTQGSPSSYLEGQTAVGPAARLALSLSQAAGGRGRRIHRTGTASPPARPVTSQGSGWAWSQFSPTGPTQNLSQKIFSTETCQKLTQNCPPGPARLLVLVRKIRRGCERHIGACTAAIIVIDYRLAWLSSLNGRRYLPSEAVTFLGSLHESPSGPSVSFGGGCVYVCAKLRKLVPEGATDLTGIIIPGFFLPRSLIQLTNSTFRRIFG